MNQTENQDGYEKLAVAVIKQAIDDYASNKNMRKSVERFLLSDHYHLFGFDVDPEVILNVAKEKARDSDRRKLRKAKIDKFKENRKELSQKDMEALQRKYPICCYIVIDEDFSLENGGRNMEGIVIDIDKFGVIKIKIGKANTHPIYIGIDKFHAKKEKGKIVFNENRKAFLEKRKLKSTAK